MFIFLSRVQAPSCTQSMFITLPYQNDRQKGERRRIYQTAASLERIAIQTLVSGYRIQGVTKARAKGRSSS